MSDALNKAKSAMFQAMRLSGMEKQLGQPAEDVEQHAASEIQSADSEFNKGQTGKAMELAHAAYLSIKLSVMRLREGDTLVRELRFATKQDEYNYELESNRTHRILVEVVLKEN